MVKFHFYSPTRGQDSNKDHKALCEQFKSLDHLDKPASNNSLKFFIVCNNFKNFGQVQFVSILEAEFYLKGGQENIQVFADKVVKNDLA